MASAHFASPHQVRAVPLSPLALRLVFPVLPSRSSLLRHEVDRQRGTLRPFSNGPFPNPAGLFPSTVALQNSCLVEQRSCGPSRPTSVTETSSCDPSPCLCLSHRPRRSVTSATTPVTLYPYTSRWLGQPQVTSKNLSSCSRCPLRRFPFLTGRLRQKLWQEVVAFPPTSNTGDSTVSNAQRLKMHSESADAAGMRALRRKD